MSCHFNLAILFLFLFQEAQNNHSYTDKHTVATSSIIYRTDHCKEHRPEGSNIQTKKPNKGSSWVKNKDSLNWNSVTVPYSVNTLYTYTVISVFMGVTLTELSVLLVLRLGPHCTLELLILLKTAIVQYFGIVAMAIYESIGPS